MQKSPTKLQHSLRISAISALFSLALSSTEARAQSTRWNLPVGVNSRLQVFNPVRHDIDIYAKSFGIQGQADEESRRIPAGGTTQMNLNAHSSYSLIDASEEGLRLLWTDLSTGQKASLPVGQSHRLAFSATESAEAGDLWITNLSSQSQDGRILSWKSGSGNPHLSHFHLKAREILQIPGAGLSGSAFQIEGQWNLNAHWKTSDRIHFAKLLQNSQALPAPQGRYFVMSDSHGSTSFLVDISDPELIREAREQIKHPDDFRPRILIAEIGANQDSSNRNWFDKNQHPWSWKVTQVLRFASLASQFCDAHPQMIEDHLEAWLAGAHAGGRPLICLWSYQIVAELP